jgi:oligopeptidase B
MPFTLQERAEWGNPYRSLEELEYLAGYCPYTNVDRKNYPSILVTASLHDGEVPYWQPAKYVAKLRRLKTDDHRLVLRTNFEAGHSGSTRPAGASSDLAFEYAFLLDELGLSEAAPATGTPELPTDPRP